MKKYVTKMVMSQLLRKRKQRKMEMRERKRKKPRKQMMSKKQRTERNVLKRARRTVKKRRKKMRKKLKPKQKRRKMGQLTQMAMQLLKTMEKQRKRLKIMKKNQKKKMKPKKYPNQSSKRKNVAGGQKNLHPLQLMKIQTKTVVADDRVDLLRPKRLHQLKVRGVQAVLQMERNQPWSKMARRLHVEENVDSKSKSNPVNKASYTSTNKSIDQIQEPEPGGYVLFRNPSQSLQPFLKGHKSNLGGFRS